MLVVVEGISATVVEFQIQVHLQPQILIYHTELYRMGICQDDQFLSRGEYSKSLLTKATSKYCTDLENHVLPMFHYKECFQNYLYTLDFLI